MTLAEPGGTLAQKSWRSSKQASARGTSKRMSLEAYSMIFTTRAAHAGDWISSLDACALPAQHDDRRTMKAGIAQCASPGSVDAALQAP